MYRKTYAEINIDNLKQNVKNITSYYNDYKYYIGVVKGNAYGCSNLVINHLIDSGINYLATSSLDEALNVREQNKNIPILCLEPVNIEYIDICIKNKIAVTVHDFGYLKDLVKKDFNGTLTVHLKIDSGLNRLGLKDKKEINESFKLLTNNSKFYLEGIYSHFATFGLTDNFWDKQLQTFKDLTDEIDLSKIPIIHLGRSATIVHHPKIEFANAIRLGLIMFGFSFISPNPSKLSLMKSKVKKYLYKVSPTNNTSKIELKPVFSLFSEVIQTKRVRKGEYVGYNMNYLAKDDMNIAIIAIGYADGLAKNNTGRDVEINNKRYPIIGTIGMDMSIVKVDDSVKQNDKVTLIGGSIPIREVARHLGFTPCMIMTTTTDRVPRVLVSKDKVIQSIDRFS